MGREQKILERADAWQRAIEAGDRESAGEYLADGYALVVTHPEPATMTREAWLAFLPEYDVLSYSILDRRVDVRDGFIVVSQRVDMTAVVAGTDRSGVFVLVDLWENEGDTWRVWRRYSTPLAAGRLPGV